MGGRIFKEYYRMMLTLKRVSLPAGPARKVPAGREALLSVSIILQYS